MGAPPIVMQDQVMGVCPNHMIPSPVGSPMPSPPMPFSAPITVGLCQTVQIGGKPAAVAGCTGYNTPPHVGLHPSDPFLVPTMQIGTIVSGSPTVMFGGQPAATATSTCTCCVVPGNLVPSVTTVLVG